MARRARFELAQHLKCSNGLANRPLQPNLGTSALWYTLRDLNPDSTGYEPDALTIKLRVYMVPATGLEPVVYRV